MHTLKKRIKQGEVELLESFNRKICVFCISLFVMCVYGEDWKKMLVSMGKVEGETFYARARALIHQVHIYSS